MISITSYRDEELTIIEMEPFAWMMWPIQLVMIAIDTVRTAVEQVHSDRAVVIEPVCYKEILIPKGCKGFQQHRVIRTSTLMPVFRITRYEAAEDYLAAKRRISEPVDKDSADR